MNPSDILNMRTELDLNQEDFGNLFDISKRTVANYEAGTSKPNQRTLLRLTKTRWLIDEAKSFGLNVFDHVKKGKLMQHNEAQEKGVSEEDPIYIKKIGVPYYDIDFTASFLEVQNNQQSKPDHYVSHPFFKGCDFIVRASGQSMAKVIKHGDAIGLIEIKNWREFIQLGEIYAIVTDEYRMIKVLTKGDDNENFTLLSKPSEGKIDDFPAQQLPKKLIKSIYKVQASSHLF